MSPDQATPDSNILALYKLSSSIGNSNLPEPICRDFLNALLGHGKIIQASVWLYTSSLACPDRHLACFYLLPEVNSSLISDTHPEQLQALADGEKHAFIQPGCEEFSKFHEYWGE